MAHVHDELKGDCLEPFYLAFKSEETKENYATKLRHFLSFANLSPGELVQTAKKNLAV